MFGDCFKCGGSDAKDLLEKISQSSYSGRGSSFNTRCPNCGKKLYIECTNCNGTGYAELFIPDYSYGPKFCSECGRKLNKPLKSSCSFCSGSGLVKKIHICNIF